MKLKAHATLLLAASLAFAALPAVHAEDVAVKPPPERRRQKSEFAVELIRDGKPQATIVLPVAHTHLDFAVQELNDHVETATGCRFPIVVEGEKVEGNLILIGASGLTQASGIDPAGLPREGFITKTEAGKLILLGNESHRLTDRFSIPTRGTLWAVYDFLENTLGIRWYFPGPLGTVIPQTRDLTVAFDVLDYPEFPMRHFDGGGKSNPYYWNPSRARTLGIPKDGTKHSLRMRVNNETGVMHSNHATQHWGELYHESNPEYFAVNVHGERQIKPPANIPTAKQISRFWHGHLKYSSEAVLRQFIANHVDWYEGRDNRTVQIWKKIAHPARWPNDYYIPFSPTDCLFLDQSPDSLPYYETALKNDFWGIGSDYVFAFCAKFAAAMHERYPHLRVCALAYHSYALPPEKIKSFPPNLHVQLAVMMGVAMLKERHVMDEWVGYAERWHRLTGNTLTYWHYLCWPAITEPVVSYGAGQEFFRRVRKFSEGAFFNGGPASENYSGVIAFHHLNYYFLGKIMWNPDYDLDMGLREYTAGMYGPAADEMHAFFTLLRKRWEETQWQIPVRQRVPSTDMLYGKNGCYPPAVVAELKGLLEKAAARDLGDIERRRVNWIRDDFREWFTTAENYHAGSSPYSYCCELDAEPVIDGDIDERAWRKIPPMKIERYSDDGTPARTTSIVKIGRFGDALYVAVKNDEPHTDKMSVTARDGGATWHDDCIELYLDKSANRADYFQFVVNASGAKTFVKLETGLRDMDWQPRGAVTKTKISADNWQFEMKLPFAALDIKPDEARRWVWNVFRQRHVPDVEKRYLALSPTFSRGTKAPNALLDLFFVPRQAGLIVFGHDENPVRAAAKGWSAKLREVQKIDNAVSIRDIDGTRTFDIAADLLTGEQAADFSKTLRSVLFNAPLSKSVPLTDDTVLDVRFRITDGLDFKLLLSGEITTPDGKREKFGNLPVFSGQSNGGWMNVVVPLVGKKIDKKNAIPAGGSLEKTGLTLEFPTGRAITGEIAYALVIDRARTAEK